jgi:hypothetical protein
MTPANTGRRSGGARWGGIGWHPVIWQHAKSPMANAIMTGTS